MIHGEGPEALPEPCHALERNEFAPVGPNVEERQGSGIQLITGLDLHDHLVLVVGCIDRGDLPRAVGRVQGVLDRLHRDPVGGGLVPVDLDVDLRILDLQIRGHIHQRRYLAHLGLENRRHPVELIRVRALQRELILALGHPSADVDGRRVLEERPNPRHLSDLCPELVGNLVGRQCAFASGLEPEK